MDVPKGVSLVVASDPELRQWFNKTVRPKMAEAFMWALEAEMVIQCGEVNTRKNPPVTGLRGWWASCLLSGAGDPHLHNHLIISATAKTEDGHVGQIDGRRLLWRGARIAYSVARRVLVEEAAMVGLKFGLNGELVGIDRELIKKTSVAGNAVDAIQTYFAGEGIAISRAQCREHWKQITRGKDDKGLPDELVNQIRKSCEEGLTLGVEELRHSLDAGLSQSEKAEAVGRWLAGKYGMEEDEWVGLADKARAAAAVEPDYDDVERVLGLIATLKRAPTMVAVEALCTRFVEDADRQALMDVVCGQLSMH
jgi:hypothetical protein